MDQKSAKLAGIILGILVVTFSSLVFFKNRSSNGRGPSWEEHDGELVTLERDMKDLLEKIQKSTGNLKCKESFQCHNIGMGVSTCGGYNNFLVYSSYDTDEADLLSLVRDYNAKSTRFNDLSMKVPPCGKPPAQVRCIEGQCYPDEN